MFHPANNEGVPGSKDIEQPPSFGAVGEPGAQARYAMVGHHLVQVTSCGLGLCPLVGEGLLGGADPRVENGSAGGLFLVRRGSVLCELVRNGVTDPSGLVLRDFFAVHKPIPLRTIRK
jgi:hypothetical protein